MSERLKGIASYLVALPFLLMASPAAAYDWMVVGDVNNIEVTYMPDRVVFELNVAAGTCAAGSMLAWIAKGADAASKIANVQAILSVLMTAKTTGKQIRIYGNNSGCTVDYIHFP